MTEQKPGWTTRECEDVEMKTIAEYTSAIKRGSSRKQWTLT